MSFSFGFEPDEPMAAAEYGQWISALLEKAPPAFHNGASLVEHDVLQYVRALERLATETHRIVFSSGHGDKALWDALEVIEGSAW